MGWWTNPVYVQSKFRRGCVGPGQLFIKESYSSDLHIFLQNFFEYQYVFQKGLSPNVMLYIALSFHAFSYANLNNAHVHVCKAIHQYSVALG
jgi:hypothetical protein